VFDLTDEALIEAFILAKDKNLDKEFIQLLQEELNRRGIHVEPESGGKKIRD
jgi:hypothetical protein